jgi:cytochrome o ubiquinol oxidase subunit 3
MSTVHATSAQAHEGYRIALRDEIDRRAKRLIVGYGFWIWLLSDIILFAAFFAGYAVLAPHTTGGPSGRDLFRVAPVEIETACLLCSSFACGIAMLGALSGKRTQYYSAMASTFAFGAAFLGLEIHELSSLVAAGAGPTRSAFLSSFFALIGCHGLHVAAGLLWLLTMVAQVMAKGFRDDIQRRLLCFGLFWHTLGIVWVALFSLVYLVGVAPK